MKGVPDCTDNSTAGDQDERAMRILTRDDLDGLACSALIGLHEEVDEILLTHPQRIADGHIRIDEHDIIANLPYRSGCALWVDHHLQTSAARPDHDYAGAFRQAPSAAHLVYEY